MTVDDNAYLARGTSHGAFAWLHASWTAWNNCFEMELALTSTRSDLRYLGGSDGPKQLREYPKGPKLGPPTYEQIGDSDDDSWCSEFADVRSRLAGSPAIGPGLYDADAVLRVVGDAHAL